MMILMMILGIIVEDEDCDGNNTFSYKIKIIDVMFNQTYFHVCLQHLENLVTRANEEKADVGNNQGVRCPIAQYVK